MASNANLCSCSHYSLYKDTIVMKVTYELPFLLPIPDALAIGEDCSVQAAAAWGQKQVCQSGSRRGGKVQLLKKEKKRKKKKG